jgi:elongation factor P
MYSGNDLRKGVLIDLEGVPFRVVEYSHHALGRGGGVVNVKIKNLVTGNVLDKTFRPSDKVPAANVERVPVQYLYREGSQLVFMNQETFEQQHIEEDVLGDQAKYLPEGGEVQLLTYADKVIGMDMPNNIFLKVTHTEPGLRGDTATAAMKPATVETGVQVNVPLFINVDDVIKVDTRTGAYLERQK